MKLGVVMDPIQSINIKKDSTFEMLWQAQLLDWDLHYFEMDDLSILGAGEIFDGRREFFTRRLHVEERIGDHVPVLCGQENLSFSVLGDHRRVPQHLVHVIHALLTMEIGGDVGSLLHYL